MLLEPCCMTPALHVSPFMTTPRPFLGYHVPSVETETPRPTRAKCLQTPTCRPAAHPHVHLSAQQSARNAGPRPAKKPFGARTHPDNGAFLLGMGKADTCSTAFEEVFYPLADEGNRQPFPAEQQAGYLQVFV